jgi:hypothetical protein
MRPFVDFGIDVGPFIEEATNQCWLPFRPRLLLGAERGSRSSSLSSLSSRLWSCSKSSSTLYRLVVFFPFIRGGIGESSEETVSSPSSSGTYHDHTSPSFTFRLSQQIVSFSFRGIFIFLELTSFVGVGFCHDQWTHS